MCVTWNLSRNVQLTCACCFLNAALTPTYLPQNSVSSSSEQRIWSRSRFGCCRLAWLKACLAPAWELIAQARWELAALRDKRTNYEIHFRNYIQQSRINHILTTVNSSGKDQVSHFINIIYVFSSVLSKRLGLHFTQVKISNSGRVFGSVLPVWQL